MPNKKAKKMKITLLLVSKDEEKHVPKFLASLKKQTRKPDELLVVDSSTDKTPVLLSRYAHKIIRTEPRGCCRARILGISKSKGDIIVFTDIDTILYPNWLEELVKPFDDPNVMAVQGRINSVSYDGKRDRSIFSSDLQTKGRYICGCNVAFRKKLFKEFPLDPNQTWEDIELGYRISKKYTIFGAKNAIIYHYGPLTLKERDIWNSALWSGVGWSRILLKQNSWKDRAYWIARIYYNIFNLLVCLEGLDRIKRFSAYSIAFPYALYSELTKKTYKNSRGRKVIE